MTDETDDIQPSQLRERVKGQLQKLLGISLGLNIYPPLPRLWGRVKSGPRPLARSVELLSLPNGELLAGFQMALVYFLGFGLLPWFVTALSDDSFRALRPLLVLQLYGALWAGWATTSTRLASRSIMDIVERDLLPSLSRMTLEQVSSKLASVYDGPKARLKLYAGSWTIGSAAAAISTWLVHRDLTPRFEPGTLDLLWWWMGWTLLYTTAAKVVISTRCFKAFAQALANQEDGLFWPSPASSSAIASVALVARRMLFFWFSIAVSIAMILPFGLYLVPVLEPEPFIQDTLRTRMPMFVLAHLIGTALFSIGAGSVIFLQTEAKLKRAAQVASAAALRDLEKAVGTPDEWTVSTKELDRLAQIKSLHADAAAGASYRVLALSGFSLIIPFVPVLTLLLKEWLERG